MPQISVGTASIEYELYGGRGDPTLLIHGSWVDHRAWGRVAGSLGESMRTVAYDRRGYGGSTGPPRTHPVRDDVDDAANLLEALNEYPAHIVGHSYGGAVALRLAAERPELVRSLAVHEPPFLGWLTEPSPGAPEAAFALQEIRRIIGQVRAGDRSGAAENFAERFVPGPSVWERMSPPARARFAAASEHWVEEFEDPDAIAPAPEPFRSIQVPALLTWGEQSAPVFEAVQRELGRILPNATVVTLPGTAHLPQLTHPDLYVGALVTFLLERDIPPA